MAFLDINGKQIFYEVQGEGHPLVLLHSDMMDGGMYAEQVKAFSPHYQVITYDLYGYGQSVFTEQKIVDHNKDLEALLKHLKVEKVYVLGTSMGSETALTFTQAHPAVVDALIVVGPGLEGYDYPEDMMHWWGDFIGAIHAGDYKKALDVFIPSAIDSPTTPMSPELRQSVTEKMSRYSFRHYADNDILWPAGDGVPQIKRLSAMTCPVLVIVGAGEKPVTLDVADVMVKEIPKAQKVVVPGAGHLVNLQQPEAFNKAVLDFLGGLSKS